MVPESLSRFDPIELSDPAFECNGVREITFYSSALGGRGDVSLFTPRLTSIPADAPLIFLLHGVYSSHWSWFSKGAAHLTAQILVNSGEIRPMVLVTPSDGLQGDGSGYLPYPKRNFERWITHDVVDCIREKFALTGPAFLSGLSMGGYGALRLGFKYPDRFAAISTHSAITAVEQMRSFVRDDLHLDQLSAVEPNILHWAQLHRDKLPAVRFDCGRDDPLFDANKQLDDDLTALGIAHEFIANDGAHTWDYWREHLADTLRFFENFLLRQEAQAK